VNRLTARLKGLGRPVDGERSTSAARHGERRHRLLTAVLADQPAPAAAARTEVRAAVAVGDRLRLGLGWEWRQDDLTPTGWATVLEGRRPDLVLVEVTHGAVPGWGPVTGEDLSRLGRWCQEASIPLVVWVTTMGNPAGGAAPLFEAATCVFVADKTAVPAWRGELPGQRVEVLFPAAQPRVHNPALAGPGERRELGAALVVEAGGQAPAEGLVEVVAPALKPMPTDELDVWQLGSDLAPLPATLQARLVGSVSYAAAATVPGRYRVLVDAGRRENVAAWTVMEAGAAQTPSVILTSQLDDLPDHVAGLVAAADEPKALRSEIVARIAQPELRDREALRMHRAVLDSHTFAHRVDSMLGCSGLDVPARDTSISAIVPTNRRHEIDNILENLAQQSHTDVELVLVLHGVPHDRAELTARAREHGVGNLTIIEADSSLTLGACLNLGIDAADGAYIAKMDDDNVYGRNYLRDLVRAFDYTDAGIVGKWAHYVWLRSIGAVVLRYVEAEHTYERRVQGGSMLIDGGLARSLRFGDLPRAVDSDILDRAITAGVRIYSSDRFNFVSVRGTDPHAHTWTVADSTFMTSTGRLVFYGDPRPHVEV
jgi:hypothetical protein